MLVFVSINSDVGSSAVHTECIFASVDRLNCLNCLKTM